jgi:hypothetical protein
MVLGRVRAKFMADIRAFWPGDTSMTTVSSALPTVNARSL